MGWASRSAAIRWSRPTSRPVAWSCRSISRCRPTFAYYLVYPPEAIRRRKIKAFRDWMISLAEVQQQQPQRAA